MKAKLNIVLLEKEKVLTQSDKQAMQEVFNIEHYLLSDTNYDASSQIGMLKELIENCSPRVAEHLKAFLASF